MTIEIDHNSGFCNGVVRAIQMAERELEAHGQLFCLGDIVHNSHEVERLKQRGLEIIDSEKFAQLTDTKVLLRAHGEPPATYRIAKHNHLEVIDATCGVVLQLQRRIRKTFLNFPHAQVVIFGKHGHAEVLGLVGQTEGHAIVIENLGELEKIDFTRDIQLFSQTTKSRQQFAELVAAIKQRIGKDVHFCYCDTICRQVANRSAEIRQFAARFDLVLFVGDIKSSNGRILFEECCRMNTNTHFISDRAGVQREWLEGVESVGICGATSTPRRLMEDVENCVRSMGT